MHLLRSCCWFFGSRTHRKRNLRSFDTWAECSAHIAHGCACAFVLRWDFFFCVHELQRHTRTQSRVIVHFSLFVVCLYSSVQLFCIIITFVFACCWCCSCCIVFITFSWRFATFASTFISFHFISCLPIYLHFIIICKPQRSLSRRLRGRISSSVWMGLATVCLCLWYRLDEISYRLEFWSSR